MNNLFIRLSVSFAIIVMLAGVLAAPYRAAAATDPAIGDGDVPVATTIDTPEKVQKVIERITNWMFTLFIAAAAIMIIYAAFTYLTSEGGEEVSKAHKMILYSAIAIAVATASRGLVTLVKNFIRE